MRPSSRGVKMSAVCKARGEAYSRGMANGYFDRSQVVKLDVFIYQAFQPQLHNPKWLGSRVGGRLDTRDKKYHGEICWKLIWVIVI